MAEKMRWWYKFDPAVIDLMPIVRSYMGLNDTAYDWAIKVIQAGFPLPRRVAESLMVAGFEPIQLVPEMDALKMWGGSCWIGKEPPKEVK